MSDAMMFSLVGMATGRKPKGFLMKKKNPVQAVIFDLLETINKHRG